MGVIVAKPKGSGANLVKEFAVGTVDGVNKNFETTQNYFPNTLTVFLNGLRERYITETGGKTFQFDEAPLSGMFIDVEYIRY